MKQNTKEQLIEEIDKLKAKIAELRKNREYSEIIAENTSDYIAITTFDPKVKFLYVSPSIKQIMGHDPKDMLGKSFFELIHPDDKKVILPLLKRYLRLIITKVLRIDDPKITEKIEFRFKDKTGNWHNMQSTLNFIGKTILSITRDITERKKTENLLLTQHDLVLKLNTVTKLDEMLGLCLDAAISISGMDCGGIYLVDKNGGLELKNGKGLSAEFIECSSYYAPSSQNAKLVMERNPIYSRHREIGVDLNDIDRKENLKATAIIPINFEGKVIACFNIASHSLDEIPVFSRNALETTAGQIGNALSRIKTEEEIRKMSKVVENTPEAVVISDINGKVEYVNQGVLALGGFEDDRSIIGKPVFMFSDEEGAKKLMETIVPTILSKGKWTGELPVKRKDGSTYPAEMICSLILDEDGKPKNLVSHFRDITKRKTAEKLLRENEEKYRAIVENSHDAVYIYKGGKFLFVNDKTCELSGYTKEQLYGMIIWDLIHPDDRKRIQEYGRKRFAGEEAPNTYSARVIAKNGDVRNCEFAVSIIPYKNNFAVLGAIRDITQSKKAEEEIKKLSTAIEQSGNTVVITDTGGNIEYTNPKFTELTGYSAGEALGQNPRILNAGTQPGEYYADMWRTISSGKIWEGEFHNKTKNGHVFWEHVTITPIKNDDGKIINYLAIKEDITEQKKARQELVIAKERAEENNRLKTAFLQNISHEIRTPMNGILGFAELLNDPGLSGGEQKSYIEIITASGNRMLNTLNDLMDISKLETGQVKLNISTINVNDELKNLYDFFKPEVENKGMRFNINLALPTNEANVKTDQEKFYATLANLIKNSIKYSNEGSMEIGYDLKVDNGPAELEFYVKDTGIGIPKNRQEAIFDRFVQADIEDVKAYEGAGLGLSISKAYVEMLGGKIWVESEVGVGSRFCFTIPYNADNKELTESGGKLPGTKQGNKANNLKILIAEDEAIAYEYLRIVLNDISTVLLQAKTGTETVELCRQNPDIDLILMDIKMPVMSGYEATRQIRKFNKNVVIIAQTAYALEGDREKAMEAGCDDYISKPIDKDELLGMIGKWFQV